MAREEQTLFPLHECQPPALRLRAGELHRNFVRERKGQNNKCTYATSTGESSPRYILGNGTLNA